MDGAEERVSKRRRLENPHYEQISAITTADQLHQLLHFRQSITPDVKAAVNDFKDFLTKITQKENVAAQARDLQVLRQYCNAQTAPSKDDHDFPDLISTWSFAAQSNNDSICSAIPAALAQFYKTISGLLEFREFGLSLGHTLLKRDQVRLFDRGLSASKTRQHLISPCLRLLTEIISFDGGTLAARAFDRRDVLFKRLDFLLEQQNVETEGGRRKPSVRRMALRLLIANFKFQDASAKAEFAAHGRIFRNCLRGLPADGDDIVVDVLKSIEVGIVEDKDIPRITRVRILGQDTLTSLAMLYNYEPDPDHENSATHVRHTVHELLLKICTTRKGILLPQNGWYPVAFETRIEAISDDNYIDLGLDSPMHIDEYRANIPVKNGTLSAFAQSLKPDSDTLQSTLLVQMLRSAPELVADYFSRKTKFLASSSDDPTWRSQFAFLFSVSQLPIPKNFGRQDDTLSNPPPIPVVVESIIPRPLDRTTLSKYFTSNEEILVLSAARLLIVALNKVHNVLKLFAQKSNSGEWLQASARLIEAILHRAPKLQEIINSLQRTGKDNESVRLTLFECLAIYHRILPEATTGSKFDIGATLLDVMSRCESSAQTPGITNLLEEQILYLVEMAELSPATKWWNKADSDTTSLFSQLFRFATLRSEHEVSSKVLNILRSVVESAGFLNTDTLSLTALQISTTSTKKFKTASETWLLLDNAIHRAVQRPVKYLDQIEAIQQTVSDRKPLSLLAAAVAEQWEFVLKKYTNQKDVLKYIAEWLVRFYGALDSAGENFRVMQQFQEDMLQLAEGEPKEVLQKAIDRGRRKPVTVETIEAESVNASEGLESYPGVRSVNLDEMLGTPIVGIDSMEGIDHWDEKTDVDLAIQSGRIAKLLHCTASQQEEVRRQAFLSLQSFAHIINQSSYDEKIQVHLLFGEIIQTIRGNGLETSLPSVAADLAVRLLQIVADPAHKMYGKVNRFLLRAPVWDLKRLLSYWIKDILFQEPESDDAGSSTEEVEWLIQWLVDGLKTGMDMEMYRRGGVYEKVLAIYTKPGLGRSTRKLILTLIWRGVGVDGANTLITRVGIRNWLRVAETMDREHLHVIQQLDKSINMKCDTALIKAWQDDLPALRTEDV